MNQGFPGQCFNLDAQISFILICKLNFIFNAF